MAGGTICSQPSFSSGVPVPGQVKRCVTFKNTPEVHVMTPQCTPPAIEGGGWAGADPYNRLGSDGPPAPCSPPPSTPLSRSRVAGPYHCLAPTDPSADENSSPQLTPAHARQLSWHQRLKNAAKALKREVLSVYYAMQHPQTPFLAKAIACLVLAYALSPLDLIPDFIPVLGLIDDLILLPLMIAAAIKLIPCGVMQEARRRAVEEPVRLSRNWPMAVLITGLWLACLEWLLYWLVNHYGMPVMRQYLPYGMVGLGMVCMCGFIIWLVRQIRKERKKQWKVTAAVIEKRKVVVVVAAAAVAASSAGLGAAALARDPTMAGGGTGSAEVVHVEVAAHRSGVGGESSPPYPVIAADTDADTDPGRCLGCMTVQVDAGLRQPLLAGEGG